MIFSKGFTLIETLAAIGILSISIAATFTAVQNGIQNSTIAKDQITAFYMAQEAVEFIKNIRDENALHSLSGTPTPWLSGLSDVSSDPCFFGKTCTIDSPLKIVATCSLGFGSCPNLKKEPNLGLHGYTSSWIDTNFKREIQFNQLNQNEVVVTISISWTSRGLNQLIRVNQLIFNHQ